MNEHEQEGRQMTLEEIFCNQFVAPQNLEFFSAIEKYRNNPPKSHRELNAFIATLKGFLEDFQTMAIDVEGIVSSVEKYTP